MPVTCTGRIFKSTAQIHSTSKTMTHELKPKPQRLYRVEELTTQGWELADDDCVKLTREQASDLLQRYLNDGIAPNRLRAVIDDGTKV